METLPKWYDPKKKKPRLQIKILELIATRGKLSKSMAEAALVEHNHPEIWYGFKNLEEKGLIKNLKDNNPGPGKPMGKGRWKKYYKITEKGSIALIAEALTAEKFWRALITFCCHVDYNSYDLQRKVEEFCRLFLEKYLKYPSINRFSFQLDSFNKLRDKWSQQVHLKSDRVTPDQRFLEILATNRNIPLEEIASETVKPLREDMRHILSRYEEWSPRFDKFVDVGHNSSGIVTYELSLFGVMLVLSLIRSAEMGILKHGLYYKDIPTDEYYDKIASLYSDKLPLIFGKRWHLLKKVLGRMAVYNFDIFFSKKVRKECIGESSIMEEFCRTIAAIQSYNFDEIEKLKSEGLQELFNYRNKIFQDISDEEEANQVLRNFDQKTKIINELLSNYNGISSLMGTSDNDNNYISSRITNTEKAFAEEITSLYYLNLHEAHHFSETKPLKYAFAGLSKFFDPDETRHLLTPLQSLLTILKKDKELREWFSALMEVLVNYHEEILKPMRAFIIK
jgi:hypothetical protein